MPITVIEPNVVKQSAKQQTKAFSPDFGTTMTAIGNTGATALSMTSGYYPAAATQATMTALAGAPTTLLGNQANAPYYAGTATTPFSSGGYGYASGVPFSGGYAGVGAGVGTVPGSYGAPGIYGSAGYGTPGAPSQDYQEKQALFQQMNDANWEMLVAQVTVNDLSRDYQARSNILKSKSDAEIGTVRNFKA
jgi:hypothetical protein